MRVVVIEDNTALAAAVAYVLRDEGHAVDILHDGAEGDAFLADQGADVAILDVNLPSMSGIDVLRALRRRGDGAPVLLLTARGDTADRVAGLDAGADDYLVKPFEMAELCARLRALRRRASVRAPVVERVGTLRFDRGARVLTTASGVAVEAPRREIAVFECLLDRRGRLVAKSTLIDHLYGAGADVEEKVVEVYISRLRKRLKPHGVGIKAARGLGYLLEESA